ncbi:MAG: dATP pyrophosphohydrolase [Hyphomicrobiaceae bacterium]
MTPAGRAIVVRPVEGKKDRAAWLALPGRLMRGDPAWIEPLDLQERRRISRSGNPFFSFGEAVLLLAWRGDQAIGRISAQINRRHLERHDDATGHFGFFACEYDPEAAEALVDAAAQWLRSRGMRRMVGPLSFTINEEVGLLVDGFDTQPAILMGHARPWTGRLLEMAGLAKEIDTYAYRMVPSAVPPIIQRLAQKAEQSGRVAVRPFVMRNYRAEVEVLIDIFNDAWASNWGFVPFSQAEIDALVAETRHLIRGKYGRLLLLDGEPAGVMLALPDVNEATKDFGGRLLPFNWARLVATTWGERWRAARVPLLGLRKRFQRTALAPAMLALLIAEFMRESRNYPLEWAEFSWVLETNTAMTSLAEIATGPPAKTYRVYSKAL